MLRPLKCQQKRNMTLKEQQQLGNTPVFPAIFPNAFISSE